MIFFLKYSFRQVFPAGLGNQVRQKVNFPQFWYFGNFLNNQTSILEKITAKDQIVCGVHIQPRDRPQALLSEEEERVSCKEKELQGTRNPAGLLWYFGKIISYQNVSYQNTFPFNTNMKDK